jgi:hypothetical protein
MKDKVAVINWPEQFPDCPEVSFSLENTGDTLQLNFKVREDRSIARSTFDNDRVWEDSCVEFFIQFEGEQEYYNLEASCNGFILLGYRKDRSSAEHAPQEVMDKIIRKPSLLGLWWNHPIPTEWTDEDIYVLDGDEGELKLSLHFDFADRPESGLYLLMQGGEILLTHVACIAD